MLLRIGEPWLHASHRRVTTGSVALAGFIVPYAVWVFFNPRVEGDTLALARGADAARACVGDGQFAGCPDVVHFPLFQYIPAVGLLVVGLSSSHVAYVLAALSALCFIGTLGLAWWIVAPRAGRGVAAVVVAAFIAGPLLWYARSSFGEMLAAFLVLVFVETVLARRGLIAIAGTTWLAGITKETALPLLLVLGLTAVLLPAAGSRGLRVVRPQLAGLLVGSLLVLVTNASFNLFRFSSVRNVSNTDPLLLVDGLERRAELALGLWVSPNGGVLVFWPAAVLLGGSALVWGLLRGRHTVGWPALAVVAVTLVLTAGFASWFSPFGWWAWGPRLMMPWIPALTILAVVIYPAPVASLAAWIGSTWLRRILAGAGVALLALPHLAAVFPPDPLVQLFAVPDETCPVTPIVQQSTPDYWYGCQNHQAWMKTPVWIDSLRALRGGMASAFGALLVASCITAALLAPLGTDRRSARAVMDEPAADRP